IEIISEHIEHSKTKTQAAKDEVRKLALEGHEALHGALRSMSEANVALHMLTRGELRTNFELVGSEEPLRQLSDMVNRLTMALIVVGLFIGSSIVYYAGMKPIIFGIPLVGFVGYVAAFVLSCWIVIDIYLKGRERRRRKRK
ncbi:MAG: AarF/ABC1/UbiB kinase family protein, partial [Bifidobacterium castoris]|nr:AarF/ABC1/UbiB kinase family protein [Bifidobacterium castoris]